MGMKLRSDSRYVSEINVTPMVDVMLVLLIIFMVAAPMLDQGIEVDLPKTKKAPSVSVDHKPVILVMRLDGQIYMGDKKIQNIEKLLRSFDKEKQILLRADQQVPYGLVAKLMSNVKNLGFGKLGLITEEEK